MNITQAIVHFGNGSRLAEALGVMPNVISMWKARGNKIPMDVQWQLELGTEGRLKADQRPLLTKEQRDAFREVLISGRKKPV